MTQQNRFTKQLEDEAVRLAVTISAHVGRSSGAVPPKGYDLRPRRPDDSHPDCRAAAFSSAIVTSVAGKPVGADAGQERGTAGRDVTEQFVDVTFANADIDASCRITH